MNFTKTLKFVMWLGFGGVLGGLAHTPEALAADKTTGGSAKSSFMGFEITPYDAIYIVRKDVNIRARPTQKSKKIGRLEEGERIVGVGRATKDWVAYRDQGKDIGFVYEPVLYPVIDSTLSREVTGRLSHGGQPTCNFKIIFVGKSEAEGQLFQIGDYEVEWRCQQNDKLAHFTTPMFLTEGPYISTKPSVHQITIDILDLAINLEEVLSTNSFFDHEKMQVVYEKAARKRLFKPLTKTEAQVNSIADALEAAVRFAYTSWDEILWVELMKRQH